MTKGLGRRLVRVFLVVPVLVFAGCNGFNLPAPSAPGGIKAQVKSATTITVSWNAVTGATDYEISYGTQADALTNTLSVASADTILPGSTNTRSTDITDLTADTTYYFSVRAGNSGGWSEASEPKSAKTGSAGGPGSGLSIPQILEAVANSHESVSLSWETVLADFYYLYRAEGADTADAYTLIGTPSEPSYTDMTAKPGTTYYYRVSAISGAVEGDKSGAKNVTTPARPEDSAVPEGGLSNALRWLKSNAGSNGAYTVELTADETLQPVELSYAGKTNITITIKSSGENRTITLNGTDSIFKIASGVTLILGPGVTLRGDSTTKSNTKALVQVFQGGKLVMQEGAAITGNTISYFNSQGGGVYVAGAFVMDGGEISGNVVKSDTRSAYGGGVYVYKGAAFIMNGGRISGNTATSSLYSPFGGGVYISDAATFAMNGGEISRNTVESRSEYVAYGGGVSVEGVFTMNNGKIGDNSASAINSSAYGGGVYTASAFTMKGGEISGNRVSTSTGKFIASGGGVYSAGGLLMSGGKVNGNTASSTTSTAYGGGVYLAKDTVLILEGGEICDNTVSSSSLETVCGGGIYAGGDLYITAGKINGNTLSSTKVSAYGGGIFAFGEFTMSGGEINGNTLNTPNASTVNVSCGAGVFVNGSFAMGGGDIKDNKSVAGTSTGGGVFVNTGSDFIMDDGTMSGNTASYGGGVYVHGTGILKKSSFGGIIYGSDDSTYGNVAINGEGFGHVAYVYSGEVEAGGESAAVRRIRIDRAYAARDVDDEAAGDSDGADDADEDDAPAGDAGEDEGGDDAPAGDEPSNIKYRDITAGAAVGLDSGKAGSDGGWQ